MRLQTWGPIAVLLLTPFLVAWPAGDHELSTIAAVPAFIASGLLLLPLSDLMRRRGRARPGSVLAAAQERRPWLAALASSLLLLSLRLPTPAEVEPRALPLVRVLIGAAIVVLLAVDVRALVRLGRGIARPHTLRLRTPGSPPPDRATLVLDFGVGHEELEELSPSAAVYREPPRLARLVRGSLGDARRALLGGIAFDVAVLVPSLVALACWLVARGVLQ